MQDLLTFTNTTGLTKNITVTWAFDGTAGSSLDGLDFLFCFGASTSCLGNPNGAGPHGPINGGQIFTFTEDCIDGNCGDPNPTTTLPTDWLGEHVGDWGQHYDGNIYGGVRGSRGDEHR